MSKIACINTKDIHLLDHIAPLAHILDAPLYIEDKKNFDLVKTYYPDVNIIFQSPIEMFSLVKNYEILIENTFWMTADFYKLLNNNVKLVFCPHGNSDKGFIEKNLMTFYKNQHAVLLYGNQMVDALKKLDVFDRLQAYTLIGNYRLKYYLKFKEFLDKKVLNLLKNFNKKNKTILYAPTWKDLENSTSFFDLYPKLIKSMPKNYNLIIKLHPLLEERTTKEFYQIYEEIKDDNVFYLSSCPLIYPILNQTDIYLGDFSSVGYDFLYFQKPMFFLDKKNRDPKNDSLALHNCGRQIPKENWDNIFEFIEKNESDSFKKVQKKYFDYAFADISLSTLKKNVLNLI